MHRRPLNIFILHPSDLLTDCLPHGDGLLANLYIRKLAERGHSLHVAATDWRLQEQFPENVKIHEISVPKPSTRLLSRLVFARRTRALFSQLSGKKAFEIVHQLNPVVTGLALGMVGINTPLILGPYVPQWPLVRKENKLVEPDRTQRMGRTVKRLIWSQQNRIARGIILSSPAAMERVPDATHLSAKIRVIPYGIDVHTFRPDKPVSNRTILFLAKISHHKGVMVLLEAFRLVRQEVPDAELVVAGEGPEMPAARELASTIGENAIRFVGPVERKDVPVWMQDCSIFCLPSYGEAFGMGVLEAMACGRAIVATDAGGLRHIVAEQGGRKVPMGDPKSLAAALIEILSSPDLAAQMGHFNRRRVEQEYSWECVIDRLEDFYYDVCNKN